MNTQQVFQNDDLRRYILSFVVPKRCLSCNKKLKSDKKIDIIHYKDYQNNEWSKEKEKMNKVKEKIYKTKDKVLN